jgi:NTP pyrophosphatase (non-canonical NTP hydrolase)
LDSNISMDRLQTYIGTWAEETFPDHTPATIALHLLREAVELAIACGVSNRDIRETVEHQQDKSAYKPPKHLSEETADVTILALTMAHETEFSLEMAVVAKHTVNRVRKWGAPDFQGIREHEEQGQEGGANVAAESLYSIGPDFGPNPVLGEKPEGSG